MRVRSKSNGAIIARASGGVAGPGCACCGPDVPNCTNGTDCPDGSAAINVSCAGVKRLIPTWTQSDSYTISAAATIDVTLSGPPDTCFRTKPVGFLLGASRTRKFVAGVPTTLFDTLASIGVACTITYPGGVTPSGEEYVNAAVAPGGYDIEVTLAGAAGLFTQHVRASAGLAIPCDGSTVSGPYTREILTQTFPTFTWVDFGSPTGTATAAYQTGVAPENIDCAGMANALVFGGEIYMSLDGDGHTPEHAPPGGDYSNELNPVRGRLTRVCADSECAEDLCQYTGVMEYYDRTDEMWYETPCTVDFVGPAQWIFDTPSLTSPSQFNIATSSCALETAVSPLTFQATGCEPGDPVCYCSPACVPCGTCPEGPSAIVANLPLGTGGAGVDYVIDRQSTDTCNYGSDIELPDGGGGASVSIIYEPPGDDEFGVHHGSRYRMKVTRESDGVVLSDNVFKCTVGGGAAVVGDYGPTPGSGGELDAYVTA